MKEVYLEKETEKEKVREEQEKRRMKRNNCRSWKRGGW
jgi:hypothetical protein